MSPLGSFVSGVTGPSGFHGSQIGFISDLDGFDTGIDAPIDFYTPDTPEERWTVGFNGDHIGSFSSSNGNSGNSAVLNDASLTDTSTDTTLSGTYTATVDGQLQVTQVTSFEPDDTGYLTTITLTNVSDTTLTDVKYMRSFDPDNTRYEGGSNTTVNTILGQYAQDGYSLVTASSLPGDAYDALTGSPAVIYYYTSDPRAEVYVGGFRNTDPYSYAEVDQITGYTKTGDDAIGIVFNVGDLEPGESVTFAYYTGSGTTAASEDILAEIGPDPTVIVTSPVKDYLSEVAIIKYFNDAFRSQSYATAINLMSNFASLFGVKTLSNATSAVAAFLAIYNGNPTAAAAIGVQNLGSAISSYAAESAAKYAKVPGSGYAAGVVFLAGTVVTTLGYVGEQASYIDPDSSGETMDYIKAHPGEAFSELGSATVKVTTDLGSAFIGSLGGLFKL
ncbi:hypothetical protein ABLE94_00695 [Gordonia sp. VNK1]|uniref:hypothetical protein n=1 Tax=Gordonia oleivorans TaxID=3156618 RepID=UPI0032B567E5